MHGLGRSSSHIDSTRPELGAEVLHGPVQRGAVQGRGHGGLAVRGFEPQVPAAGQVHAPALLQGCSDQVSDVLVGAPQQVSLPAVLHAAALVIGPHASHSQSSECSSLWKCVMVSGLRSVVRHGDSSLSVLGCPESAHPGRYPGCTDTVHTAAYSPCSSWKYSLTVCAMPACVEGWGTVASPAPSTRRVPNCSSEPSQSADTSQSHASRGP